MKAHFKASTIALLIFILMTAASLQGCLKKNTGDNPNGADAVLAISDYFPMKENVHLVYEGLGNEFAAYDLWVDYLANGKVQQRISNGGTVVSRVIQLTDDALVKTFSREETYYRENYLEMTSGEPEVLLMAPLKVGTRWTLADGRIRSIVSTDAKVSVPFGDYSALQVITEDPKNTSNTSYDYYVKDIGLVQTVYLMGESEISSSLKEIVNGIPRTDTVQFYYPDLDAGTYTLVPKELKFYTNDSTASLLEKAYKQVPAGKLGSVFTPNTEIKHLSLSPEGQVLIDLSSDFRTQMNAGSAYEGMILQSIANTFGNYYNRAKEILLTIEGVPYSSGHYEFQEGEPIPAVYEE